MNFKIEQIIIANRTIDRIEEDGIYWYPIRSFLLRILLKNDCKTTYRDNKMRKYMKVFELQLYNSVAPRPTWCMNENGIKYLLKKINVSEHQNKKMAELRKKNLSEACLYFGINRTEELAPTFLNEAPKLEGYDFWSLICIENDNQIEPYTKWCRCRECGYYYPHNPDYFKHKKRLTELCHQCEGKNFKCKNKIIQFIYENNGESLLYAIREHDNNTIVSRLADFIERGGVKRRDN